MTSGSTTHSQIATALDRVIDPELGMSIVDLGLVYGIEVCDDGIFVELGVTTPSCPHARQLSEDAFAAILSAMSDAAVDVSFVLEPPWSPAMLSERARTMIAQSAFIGASGGCSTSSL
jgi:metal-sulfur cluster biosynthetic enzyme